MSNPLVEAKENICLRKRQEYCLFFYCDAQKMGKRSPAPGFKLSAAADGVRGNPRFWLLWQRLRGPNRLARSLRFGLLRDGAGPVARVKQRTSRCSIP